MKSFFFISSLLWAALIVGRTEAYVTHTNQRFGRVSTQCLLHPNQAADLEAFARDQMKEAFEEKARGHVKSNILLSKDTYKKLRLDPAPAGAGPVSWARRKLFPSKRGAIVQKMH